jgi:hypothetical protein
MKTRNYKIKHRKTRRGGEVKPTMWNFLGPANPVTKLQDNKPSMWNFFGTTQSESTKKYDDIINMANKFTELGKPYIDKSMTIQQIIDKVTKLKEDALKLKPEQNKLKT